MVVEVGLIDRKSSTKILKVQSKGTSDRWKSGRRLQNRDQEKASPIKKVQSRKAKHIS